jgi:uncharacterized protein with HXXEE motif
VRWHYRDAGLLWLFVGAYAVHLAEEWFAGFPAWIGTVVGAPLPPAGFLAINGAAIVLAIVGVRAAVARESAGWIAIALATIALVNTAAHLAGSLLTRTYSPGLVSAVVLYVPLGSLTMIRAAEQADGSLMRRGVAAGLLLHALVFVLAYASTRLGAR